MVQHALPPQVWESDDLPEHELSIEESFAHVLGQLMHGHLTASEAVAQWRDLCIDHAKRIQNQISELDPSLRECQDEESRELADEASTWSLVAQMYTRCVLNSISQQYTKQSEYRTLSISNYRLLWALSVFMYPIAVSPAAAMTQQGDRVLWRKGLGPHQDSAKSKDYCRIIYELVRTTLASVALRSLLRG
jgi:hypothetical protein